VIPTGARRPAAGRPRWRPGPPVAVSAPATSTRWPARGIGVSDTSRGTAIGVSTATGAWPQAPLLSRNWGPQLGTWQLLAEPCRNPTDISLLGGG
jgi:hypothetical protein